MGSEIKTVFYRNLWRDNPVIRQILGICSALAVTNRSVNSLVMGVGLMFVTAFSSLTLSALREHIPDRIRMIVQTLVIAAYVIIVDIFIKANLPEISKALGPYVGLIITNCIENWSVRHLIIVVKCCEIVYVEILRKELYIQ